MRKTLSLTVASVITLLLTGCQSVPDSPQYVVTVPFAAPLPSDYRSEVAVARYSELIEQAELPSDQQALLYYDRGKLFDSLGLSTLARIDFSRAVNLKPDLAEVYNFLGIHHTLMQQYGKAYEMFDSVLELNSEHEYAYLNRGIALYYGERPGLASDDLQTFLQFAPDDPYRVLWVYLAERAEDPVKAKASLMDMAQALDPQNWAYQLVAFYQGKITERELLATLAEGVESHQEYAERLCEAYFYIAKSHQAKGENTLASDYFKLALSTNVYEFVEYKYARLELDIMAGEGAY
ncbi:MULTISPECIES: lipoprotein NlpI [unclassified Pseudoalteromonas]|uniref:lipoprotein NlpI n=1 Tax=unclassified Pseudoalteromonas TaxID=194690 RepID=UPI000CF74AAF|nr:MULTISPECIES: lipoprotein NlpI [unclassified Pseudoalteromonas]MBS3796327.1 lipoprotein NlpI [Pseudoalteromonas sp. BDTF-M6]